jgi:iron-sulfur cluster repair protein YtfE (RIC family)
MRPVTEAPPLVDPGETVHALLERHPETAPVLERLGIHACCGGDVALSVAAERDGVDLERLLQELRAAAKPR